MGSRIEKILYWISFGLAVTAAFFLAPRHDYSQFLLQWAHIAAGGNPWLDNLGQWTNNAYGPLFSLFALPWRIHPHLPRVLFVVVWFSLSRRWWNFLNPFFWLTIVYYGQFDVVWAGAVVAALKLKEKSHVWLAGLFLAMAVHLKFLPLIFAPVLAWDFKRWRFHLGSMVPLIVLVAGGFVVTFAVYGMSAFTPLTFAAGRESKVLSFFFFLRSAMGINLDGLSLPLLIAAIAGGYFWIWKEKLGLYNSVYLILILTLLFYKVGHAQFYTLGFFICPSVELSIPLVGVAGSVVLYSLTHGFGGSYYWIRSWIAIPHTGFMVMALAQIFRKRLPLSKNRLIIFDYDGVIAASHEVNIRALNEIAKLRQVPLITLEEVRNMDSKALVKRIDVNWFQIPYYLKKAKRFAAQFKADIQCISGMREVIQELAQLPDTHLVLVSSNSLENIESLLGREKIRSCFHEICSDVHMFKKKRAMAKVVKRQEQRLRSTFQSVVSIGDETRDMEAARGLGFAAVGVGFGAASTQLLEKAGAHALCEAPAELQDAIETAIVRAAVS